MTFLFFCLLCLMALVVVLISVVYGFTLEDGEIKPSKGCHKNFNCIECDYTFESKCPYQSGML